MKQSMSPAVSAVIIVIVVAVLGFAGYKLFLSGSNKATAPMSEQQKAAMEAVKPENMGKKMQQMRRPSGGPPPGMGGPGMMGSGGGNPMAPR